MRCRARPSILAMSSTRRLGSRRRPTRAGTPGGPRVHTPAHQSSCLRVVSLSDRMQRRSPPGRAGGYTRVAEVEAAREVARARELRAGVQETVTAVMAEAATGDTVAKLADLGGTVPSRADDTPTPCKARTSECRHRGREGQSGRSDVSTDDWRRPTALQCRRDLSRPDRPRPRTTFDHSRMQSVSS